MEKYESSLLVKKIVRNIMERKDPEPPKARNPVAKNANAAVGGGGAGKHKDRKKDAKQGVQKHKGQQLDEYFEKERPSDGELLLLMRKYRLAKISGKPLASVMRQSDIHKLIDAEKDGRIEQLKYKDSIDERYDDEDDQGYTSKSDFKRRELEHELGHETRSGAVYIDGRYWKTFDTYTQAQNIARSLERKGKRAVARMLESKKPKKTAQEKLSAAVDKERKKNEPATKRAKQELDAAMPSKSLAEGRVCPQCGSSKCSCPPGKCKCKPVAGFKPKMKEAQNSAQQAAIAIAKKKEAGVAEGGPFSYGKPPRKGSVAANAAQKRKEQDRKTPAIEPKDQKVGNAKVTKDVKEGGENYKIKSTGSDVDKESGERRDYYISPSTGKKVYKAGVKKGDHENPNSGDVKKQVKEFKMSLPPAGMSPEEAKQFAADQQARSQAMYQQQQQQQQPLPPGAIPGKDSPHPKQYKYDEKLDAWVPGPPLMPTNVQFEAIQRDLRLPDDYYLQLSSSAKSSLKKLYVNYILESVNGLNKDVLETVGYPELKNVVRMIEEKQKGVDGKACWKGYKRMGTKKKGGRTVDNCVKA